MPNLIFSPVNKKLARRLLFALLVVTGISGAGAKQEALPNLWRVIPQTLEQNVSRGATADLRPYFAVSFVFSILGILFLVMILTRAADIQLFYLAGGASFALSLLWFICAVMSLLPPSLMGLHRVFVVLVVAATIAAQFISSGTAKFYLIRRSYGDLATQVVFLTTYLIFAWEPLKFALIGR